MTSWLNETKYVRDIAQSMLSSKKSQYQEDFIRYKMMELHHLTHTNFYAKNSYNQKIKATLFSHVEIDTHCCVLYLHGFGSHRLEGVTILSALPKSLSFCCFDFSGSGKSEGTTSTYGIKEHEDIKCMIDKLEEFGYRQFVLWGRSMGAVASLLYTSKNQDKRVIFQVLDSPFCNFQTIAYHYAKKSMKLPDVFINFGLGILKDHFHTHPFNPFLIDMNSTVKTCKTAALFVYCQNDKVIPPQNTLKILENFNSKTRFQKLIIEQNHNNIRNNETLSNIFSVVLRYRLKEKSNDRMKIKKGLFEVVSSHVTPKANSSHGEDSQKNGRIMCSLSKNKIVKCKKVRKIKIMNPEEAMEEPLTLRLGEKK